MAEMNGRMNHSQCIPPMASFCVQIPSFQACTEGLPLVLQRPDNFPLVMGILQEINQEKVGFSSCAGAHLRLAGISEVKQENADVEEHHQSLKSELCEEWSLKGVEELLTEPEELQLRHECSQHAHDPSVPYSEVCAPDEKHLIALQPVLSELKWNLSEQAHIHVDEKPMIQLQKTSSFEEQFLFQENALLHVDEKIDVFSTLRPEVDVNGSSQHAVTEQIQAHVEDQVGLHRIQGVKKEPEDLETQSPSSSKSFGVQKGSIGFLEGCQLVDTRSSIRLDHDVKFILPGCKSQLKRTQSSDSELMPPMEKRRLSMHTAQWNTTAVLASSADFSELEDSHFAKRYSQILPTVSPPSVAEEPICPSVSSKKGEALAERGRLQSVTSVGKPDYSELTLSLAASKPHVASSSPLLDGIEDVPIVKKFSAQGQHSGQCRRTSPHQWQQTRKRSVLCKYYRHAGQDAMPAGTKKQLFAAIDGPDGKDVGDSLKHMGRNNCKVDTLDNEGPRQSFQSMPQTIYKTGLPEKSVSQKPASSSGQITELNPSMALESSKAEVAPRMTEPERKKKMRGTLPLADKADVKDTRCHRSDGKSWRCVRECINGAYYCQYHLRKRRIGYNNRRNREVTLDDLDAVSKESLKSNKKSG
ncbi:hypothetical protein L7F22_046991 [Adiantum nelumboides]|nr:hypothetical protein [Adiantum nelumboides]